MSDCLAIFAIIVIAVGLQNSGLAVILAGIIEVTLLTGFDYSPSQYVLVAVPAVLFSVWHNITGPELAFHWASTGASR